MAHGFWERGLKIILIQAKYLSIRVPRSTENVWMSVGCYLIGAKRPTNSFSTDLGPTDWQTNGWKAQQWHSISTNSFSLAWHEDPVTNDERTVLEPFASARVCGAWKSALSFLFCSSDLYHLPITIEAMMTAPTWSDVGAGYPNHLLPMHEIGVLHILFISKLKRG